MTAQLPLTGRFMLDWSIARKCTVTMLLQTCVELFFMSWKLYVVAHPAMDQWLNLDVIRANLPISYALVGLSAAMTCLCYLWSHRPIVIRAMPYIAAWFVAIVMSYHAHLIGTLTPVTGILLIGISMFGMLLFGRWVTYPALGCALVMLGLSIAFTLSGQWVYAPVFKHNIMPMPHDALVWLSNIMLFGAPLTIGIFLLLDRIIAQWKQNAADVWRLSQTDALTGLYNRHHLSDRLTRQSKLPETVSIALLDIDHFKQINDQCGHLVGDQVLQQVATTLSQSTRHTDWLARFGGEEFIVVMPNTSTNDAIAVIERCRIAIQSIYAHRDPEHAWPISGSFGVMTFHGPFDVSTALSEVDHLLYQAKAQGRNRVIHQQHLNTSTLPQSAVAAPHHHISTVNDPTTTEPKHNA